GRRQTAKPDDDVMRGSRLTQARRNGVTTERGFKGVILSLRNGVIQTPHAFLPGRGIGIDLAAAGCCHQFTCKRIGVVPGQSGLLQQMTADRAFTGAIDASQYINDRACQGMRQKLLPALSLPSSAGACWMS